MESFNSDIGIAPVFLTIVVVLIESYFIVKLILLKFSIRFLSETEFIQVLEEVEFDTSDIQEYWVKAVVWTIFRQGSFSEIKTIITDTYSSKCAAIKHYSNLGPAVGLLFTFLGMILTLFNIWSGQLESVERISNSISSLFPVFVGSFLGIIVYSFGCSIQKQIVSDIEKHSQIYLNVCFGFDSGDRHRDLPEIYDKMYEKASKLFNKLGNINSRFDEFITNFKSGNEQLSNHLIKLDERNTAFTYSLGLIENDVGKIVSSSEKLTENISEYNENIRKYSEAINSYNIAMDSARDNWTSFFQKADNLLTTLEKINELAERFNSVTLHLENSAKELELHQNQINELASKIDKLITDTGNYISSIAGLKEDFDDFIRRIPPEHLTNISTKFSNIEESMVNAFGDLLNENQGKIFSHEGFKSIVENLVFIKEFLQNQEILINDSFKKPQNNINVGVDFNMLLQSMNQIQLELSSINSSLNRESLLYRIYNRFKSFILSIKSKLIKTYEKYRK